MPDEMSDLALEGRAHAGARPQEPLPATEKAGARGGVGEGRRVVAIAAHKGGVGKTTTSLGLGAGLARQGAQVLLIDLDPQGCASRGLFGKDVDYRAPGTADLFSDAPLSIAELAR